MALCRACAQPRPSHRSRVATFVTRVRVFTAHGGPMITPQARNRTRQENEEWRKDSVDVFAKTLRPIKCAREVFRRTKRRRFDARRVCRYAFAEAVRSRMRR